MKNRAIKGTEDFCFDGVLGDWSVTCFDKIFRINKAMIYLLARHNVTNHYPFVINPSYT